MVGVFLFRLETQFFSWIGLPVTRDRMPRCIDSHSVCRQQFAHAVKERLSIFRDLQGKKMCNGIPVEFWLESVCRQYCPGFRGNHKMRIGGGKEQSPVA